MHMLTSSFIKYTHESALMFKKFPVKIYKRHHHGSDGRNLVIFAILGFALFFVFERHATELKLTRENAKNIGLILAAGMTLYFFYNRKAKSQFFEIGRETVRLMDEAQGVALWSEPIKNYSGVACFESYDISSGKNKRDRYYYEVYLVHQSQENKNVLLSSLNNDPGQFRPCAEATAKALNLPIIDWAPNNRPKILRSPQELDSKLAKRKVGPESSNRETCPSNFFILSQIGDCTMVKSALFHSNSKAKLFLPMMFIIAGAFLFEGGGKPDTDNLLKIIFVCAVVLFIIRKIWISKRIFIGKNSISYSKKMNAGNSIAFSEIEEVYVKDIHHRYDNMVRHALYIQSDRAGLQFGVGTPKDALDWLAKEITRIVQTSNT